MVYLFVRPAEHRPSAGTQAVAQQAPETARPAGISVAVLPFMNHSADKDQEFFSDGMTEEITSALAKVPDLRVVARASAFQFKGEKKDMRAVGQALSARYLIDGSVRKAGTRVRISAQLIEAGNGLQVWTENYDRELTDIFATQEDIARAIAASLRVPLGLAQGEQLVSSRTNDVESYQQFLRARVLYRSRAIRDAIALLEPALARDATYAPSWALLGESYDFLPAYSGVAFGLPVETARQLVQSALDKAEMAAREAIRLDPKHANGYAALAFAQAMRRRWVEADGLFQKALALDTNDTEILDVYSQMLLAGSGRLKEALGVRERMRTLEPFVPIYNTVTADIMRTGGDAKAAIPILESLSADGPAGATRTYYLAEAYASAGRYKEAADALLKLPPRSDAERGSSQETARLLRSAPANVNVQALPALPENEYFYSFFGAPERSVETAERGIAVNYAHRVSLAPLWDPVNASLRKTERYRTILRNLGLVEYWRAKGWPQFCHPVGADDFACE